MKLLYYLTSLTAVLAAAVVPPEAKTQVKEPIEELAKWDLGHAWAVVDERPTPQEADDKAEDHPTITSRPTRPTRPTRPIRSVNPKETSASRQIAKSDKSLKRIQSVFNRIPPRFG
ncbi:hypothetical protein C2857_002752 [Epichloe festucae Fl1]|uniref:Uncharacterized protein n=1 Tax=Epichloe festucae (strain Fl1) TaxID=877507 RepID=A0A7U3Q2V5_EPIFF|nr:hypothetical protein C2857_002752 [Epichloe festucae Fl1]